MQKGKWTEPPGPKKATRGLCKARGQDTPAKEEPGGRPRRGGSRVLLETSRAAEAQGHSGWAGPHCRVGVGVGGPMEK